MKAETTPRVIAYSERLAPLTEHEELLRTIEGATLRITPLWTEDLIATNAATADVVMVGAVEPMNATALRSLASCRLLVRRGVGLDNIDVATATELGIPVAYVPDASVEEVSDHALALLLALERRVVRLDRFVQGKRWTRATKEIASERRGMRRLSELTLGIVGLGRIGRALAGKAASVFGTVIGHDPFLTPDVPSPIELVGFEELLTRSDLVSLHVPLTPDTAYMVGSEVFQLMKPGSFLVNTARGGLVDEEALIEALGAGRIAGAGLDVTADEPLSETSRLLGLESVILTGHSANAGVAASDEARRLTVIAVLKAMEGRRPDALANPEVLDLSSCRLQLT